MGILESAYVRNLGSTRDNTAVGIVVVSRVILRATCALCHAFVTAGMMKGVEVRFYTSLPSSETGRWAIVVCITAELWDATKSSECDEMLVICVTKRL